VKDYQNEILDLFDDAAHDGEESKGRRYIRWRFIRGLEKDLTTNFMEKIRENVDTSFYLRHVFSYQLRNIEDGTVILYYKNHGSPWINRLAEAEEWLSEEETKRLDHDKREGRKEAGLDLPKSTSRFQSACVQSLRRCVLSFTTKRFLPKLYRNIWPNT